MSKAKESWWHRYIPAHASNPLTLAVKLFRAGRPAARSAMYMAAAGIAATPLDFALRPFERRVYERAPKPTMPIIMVAGPPRSGTTLVAQYLINTFDVCYLNNLTSLFPRSPIVINKMFGRLIAPRSGGYDAFYGKSRGVAGPNDALYIWDRWLGADRNRVPAALEPGADVAIPQFFGALQNLYQLPVVNKVNRLNTCAHLLDESMPDMHFLCLQRDPLLLAQSLYIARDFISGDLKAAYGVQHSDSADDDPVEDVCRQVVFHEQHARDEQELIGKDRFEIISYEAFCKNPAGLSKLLIEKYPDLKIRNGDLPDSESFTISDKRRLPEPIFEQMRTRLAELGAGQISCRSL